MCWLNVKSIECAGSTCEQQFLAALAVWCNKPHVANRRLRGSQLLWKQTFEANKHFTVVDIAREIKSIVDLAPSLSDLETVSERLRHGLCHAMECSSLEMSMADSIHHSTFHAILRCLIPKVKGRKNVLELVLIDDAKTTGLFLPVCDISMNDQLLHFPVDVGYTINYNQQGHLFSLYIKNTSQQPIEELVQPSESLDGASHSQSSDSPGVGTSIDWLSDVLLPKLSRWAEETSLNTDILSLRHVDLQQYSDTYERLKEKYGRHFVEMWTEQTDPQKFVYEDIGIAAYLLVLWQQERCDKGFTKKQSFVDLGCGNGLLVYILASEGHPGIGLDIRARKIWETLRNVADLRVETIVPSESTIFPDYDWLIGNHSDELTPWIPLMTARSHYNCSYFVLPCCTWDFTHKFADKTSGTSQYRVYLDYIRSVGEKCGFHVKEDVLRIPSTKRVCFIGMERSYSAEDESDADRVRQLFVTRRCQSAHSSVDGCDTNSPEHIETTTDVFRPRPSVEPVRNAVAIEKSVKEYITTTVLKQILLRAVQTIVVNNTGQTWNCGGNISLNELGSLFDKEMLAKLKHECGGLQTVVKNCPDVFLVREGSISLRDWTSPDYQDYRDSRRKRRPNGKTEQRLKTSLCFYHQHHPDGCPLSAEQCRFAHGLEELRNVSVTVANST